MGTLTIGAAAGAAGVTAKAIRLYERRGLLAQAPRSVAGYRLYTDADLATLRFIRRCRNLDLTLDEIAAILTTVQAGQQPCAGVHAMLQEHIARIDQHVGDLLALRAELAGAASTQPAAGPETDTARFCPILDR